MVAEQIRVKLEKLSADGAAVEHVLDRSQISVPRLVLRDAHVVHSAHVRLPQIDSRALDPADLTLHEDAICQVVAYEKSFGCSSSLSFWLLRLLIFYNLPFYYNDSKRGRINFKTDTLIC